MPPRRASPPSGAGIVAASSAKARKPSPGFEGVNGLTFVLPMDLRVVTGESPTPWTLTVVLPVDPRVDSNDASAETV